LALALGALAILALRSLLEPLSWCRRIARLDELHALLLRESLRAFADEKDVFALSHDQSRHVDRILHARHRRPRSTAGRARLPSMTAASSSCFASAVYTAPLPALNSGESSHDAHRRRHRIHSGAAVEEGSCDPSSRLFELRPIRRFLLGVIAAARSSRPQREWRLRRATSAVSSCYGHRSGKKGAEREERDV
jgi:hypothetical protein